MVCKVYYLGLLEYLITSIYLARVRTMRLLLKSQKSRSDSDKHVTDKF